MGKVSLIIFTCSIVFYSFIRSTQSQARPRLLVFSKTLGWHHSAIPAGIVALEKIAGIEGYLIDTTIDASYFNDDSLKQYSAVVFNNTTGNVLNVDQQAALERFIQAGGGFVGIHAAADTEYDWPWYGKLVGAFFESHPRNPNIRVARIHIVDNTHVATRDLPDTLTRTDEWYNYKSFYPGIKVLAKLDENSYEGGTNGFDHPITWYHYFDGGRSFYIGGGHTPESYQEKDFIKQLAGGVRYAVGNNIKLDYQKSYSKVTPDQTRFVKKVLISDLNSPMELAVAKDGKVFFTQLFGELSCFDPVSKKVTLIKKFPVTTTGGTGMIGIALDPSFASNHYIYLYYAPAGQKEEPLYFNLSRFTLNEKNILITGSEKILLRVPVQKNSGSHHGGSLAWDKEGNLYLSTGDSSSPFPAEGFAPLDERPGQEHYSGDAQRGPSNTNDFKGKILRIHPEANGTYTIPKGNLFSTGIDSTKAEIYVMGVRNPYRIAVNPKTSVLYWGDIGPDAGENTARGPRGYDEFNQAKKAGNFGWPYFIGNNIPYAKWDYATRTAGPLFDPQKPFNHSPNNTGLHELPAAEPAMIWYPYAASNQFPELGLGGRSGMVGAFYKYSKDGSKNRFPEYYDGALFVFDWMRNWVMDLRFDSNENYLRNEPFMAANGDFRRPIDIAFSQSGIMYMLEYGSVYGMANKDAQLVKIEYNTGNRPPVAKATIIDSTYMEMLDKMAMLTTEYKNIPVIKEITGQAPLRVSFSGRGSADRDDDDSIRYQWFFDGKKMMATTADALYTYTKPGTYRALLKVMDRDGLLSMDTIVVRVGNTRPVVKITCTENLSFSSNGETFHYSVKVKDAEETKTDVKRVQTFYSYSAVPFSIDKSNVSLLSMLPSSQSTGQKLFTGSDCRTCHLPNKTVVGPSLMAIANRYKTQKGSVEKLGAKIISGGGGSWGTHVMSAHPQLSPQEAQEIVRYIFSLTAPKKEWKSIPSTGSLKLVFKENEPAGQYAIISAYTDRGGKVVGALTGQDVAILRNRIVRAVDADAYTGFPRFRDNLSPGVQQSFLLFRNIDLGNISEIVCGYAADKINAEIEVRIDSRIGPVVATTTYAPTGSWDKFTTAIAKIDKAIIGKHDVYIFAIKRPGSNEPIIRFRDIQFR